MNRVEGKGRVGTWNGIGEGKGRIWNRKKGNGRERGQWKGLVKRRDMAREGKGRY